ncbi:MAG TPA: 4-phosphopantoate--beta-alanine ligase [Candidatus Bathyarchaeia archaeon]|jgi:4-phosphopantoate---beta-alanine ligase|nr:4-phosphopantoate--beta-alanine ligase [Candidatus Bathyarchaeia archaeon]
MNRNIPLNHPRLKSLLVREKLVSGFERGLVVAQGLIAHGRGEAFDYLLGEQTTRTARVAITAASAQLLLARHPVISINGNVAAICAKEIVELSKVTNALLEVNLFYRDEKRERSIERELINNGAGKVYGVGSRASAIISELHSERRRVDPDGIYLADVVVVPLEDGERAEALVKMGKKIIAIDLNPISRTARVAQITIVDNIIRVLPTMIPIARELRSQEGEATLTKIIKEFNNKENLEQSLRILQGAENGLR